MPNGRAIKVSVHSQSNDPAIVVAALGAAAHEYGLADQVEKALLKPTVETVIPDAGMRGILARVNRAYGVAQGRLYRNIMRYGEVELKGAIQKASRDELLRLFTAEQLERLREIIRLQISSGGMLTPQMEAWAKRYGFEHVDWGFLPGAVEEAYIIGRLSELANLHIPYEELLVEARKRPMTRIDQLSLQSSLGNTREHLRRLGNKVAGDVVQTISRADAKLYAEVINQYMKGDLKLTQYSPVGGKQLTASEYAALGSDRIAENERQLRGELYSYFKSDPQQTGRDMWRVATSETRAANNTGRLLKIGEDGYNQFYYLVQVDSCRLCKQTYLEVDGSPKLFSLGEVLTHALDTNGMNIDKEHKGLPNSLLHPYCQCTPVAHVEGQLPVRFA